MLKQIETKLDSFEIYTVFKDEDHSFILDSAMDEKRLGRYSIIGFNPAEIIRKKAGEKASEELRAVMKKYEGLGAKKDDRVPFQGGAVGYMSYDLGWDFEKIKKTTADDVMIPDMYFGIYKDVIVIDHLQNKTYISCLGDGWEKRIEGIEGRIDSVSKEDMDLGIKDVAKKTLLRSNFKKDDYLESIEKIREYIKSGDIYQANMTQRFEGEIEMDSYDLYNRLRTLSPAPFGAFLDFDGLSVLSNSPERFIKLDGRKVQTRPIKGTRPRGKTQQEDEMLKKELLNSEKDKAELLMIVDLERNDIGRVSKIGSVKVPELFKIEEYTNVNHLVATVDGELKDGLDAIDVVGATFPGGSITGAPKIRAMEIIDELEPTSRKVYTGSIGYMDFNGDMDMNIAIRTLVKKGDKVYFQVGGGITWDSDANDEYQETLDKAKSIKRALDGIFED